MVYDRDEKVMDVLVVDVVSHSCGHLALSTRDIWDKESDRRELSALEVGLLAGSVG